jgi:hypothetical protein
MKLIAQKMWKKIDFEIQKLRFWDNRDWKSRAMELHMSADLQPAITLARINIFWWGKKQLVPLTLHFQKTS